jgi:hypothetical protein
MCKVFRELVTKQQNKSAAEISNETASKLWLELSQHEHSLCLAMCVCVCICCTQTYHKTGTKVLGTLEKRRKKKNRRRKEDEKKLVCACRRFRQIVNPRVRRAPFGLFQGDAFVGESCTLESRGDALQPSTHPRPRIGKFMLFACCVYGGELFSQLQHFLLLFLFLFFFGRKLAHSRRFFGWKDTWS